jgi:putative glycosyltransferase
VSVVTSLYHSAPYIEEFYRRCVAAIRPYFEDIEFVFVDDGSPDESVKVVTGLLEEPEAIRVIRLARNYGHMRAIMVGLEHAKGDFVFLLDCDLEEPPELFARLYHEFLAPAKSLEGIDVAYAVQRRRKGGVIERLSGRLFYQVFNLLSPVPIPRDWMICRLMTQRYVRSLVTHQEREVFFGGLAVLTGFKQVPVLGDKQTKGSTTYSLARRLSVSLQALIAFSERPLYLIFFGGIAVSTLAISSAGYLFIQAAFFHYPYAGGWPSILVAISFFGGLTLAALGVIGLYLGKVLVEVKARPCIIHSAFENRGFP